MFTASTKKGSSPFSKSVARFYISIARYQHSTDYNSPAMSTLPPGVPTAGHLLTGLIVGELICLVQYGICVSQAYIYVLNCDKDSRLLRSLVAFVFFCETAQTAFLCRALVYYTILSFGSISKANHIDWSIPVWLALMVPVVIITQGFYIHRIHRLSRESKTLLWIGISLLVIRIGFHIVAFIYTIIEPSWSRLETQTLAKACVDIANSVSAVIDAYLAITLVYYLFQSRSDFNHRTDSVVRWIVAYTVNTGLLAMIISIVIVITFVTVKGSLAYAGLINIQAKLYSNCFFGALNARPFLRARLPVNILEVTNTYEMSRMGIVRYKPRFEVIRETIAIGNQDNDVNRGSVVDTISSIPRTHAADPIVIERFESKNQETGNISSLHQRR